MNNNIQHQESSYYESSSRSPPHLRSQQSQGLRSQSSRIGEGHNGLNNNSSMYSTEEQQRYEQARGDNLSRGASSGYGYDGMGAQSWNPNAFSGGQNYTSFPQGGATGRLRNAGRGRPGLPNTWFDNSNPPPLPPQYAHMGAPHMMPPNAHMHGDMGQSEEEDLIPTAIVIKNIPFAVKKEALTELMTQMGLPLPYAFNYHFDSGVFRGLAFANFSSSDETRVVIQALNHYELHGRKLRVEYKKMLPQAERERIELEKRARRGQLEEQHRPVMQGGLHHPPSLSSLTGGMGGAGSPMIGASGSSALVNVDLNDPGTLAFYNELLKFKDDHSRQSLVFPTTLAPQARRIVHTIAHNMGLHHFSEGVGHTRQIHVTHDPVTSSSPSSSFTNNYNGDPSIGGTRSISMFNRQVQPGYGSDRHGGDNYGVLRGQVSTGFLHPESPNGFSNLRAAKSYADLRYGTPSPANSAASFPLHLQTNRLGPGGESGANASVPNTSVPTSGSNVNTSARGDRDRERDDFLSNGMSGMNLGSSFHQPTSAISSSPRRPRNLYWDAPSSATESSANKAGTGTSPSAPPTGPIGSNRTLNNVTVSFDDAPRSGTAASRSARPTGAKEGATPAQGQPEIVVE